MTRATSAFSRTLSPEKSASEGDDTDAAEMLPEQKINDTDTAEMIASAEEKLYVEESTEGV